MTHLAAMQTRRSVRRFAPDPVPPKLIEDALRVAGSASSGANQQPWTFVVVTDAVKPHITDAPVLIVVFEQAYRVDENGEKHKHYYVCESVGIAVGFLVTALRPFLLLPVGYPAADDVPPDLRRKTLDEFAVFV